jgi:hypothetical protein
MTHKYYINAYKVTYKLHYVGIYNLHITFCIKEPFNCKLFSHRTTNATSGDTVKRCIE